MNLSMKNPKTGEIKPVQIGWSWTLFLYSGFFGLPLFLRGLNLWGGVFFVLSTISLVGPALVGDDVATGIAANMSVILFVLGIWVGIKGNEMTAKNYLDMGWVFLDPHSEATKVGKGKWGIVARDSGAISRSGRTDPGRSLRGDPQDRAGAREGDREGSRRDWRPNVTQNQA
jgi:hypothetical protein